MKKTNQVGFAIVLLCIFSFITSFSQRVVYVNSVSHILINKDKDIQFITSIQKDTIKSIEIEKDTIEFLNNQVDDEDIVTGKLFPIDSLPNINTSYKDSIERLVGKKFVYFRDSLNKEEIIILSDKLSILTTFYKQRTLDNWLEKIDGQFLYNKIVLLSQGAKCVILFYENKEIDDKNRGGIIFTNNANFVIHNGEKFKEVGLVNDSIFYEYKRQVNNNRLLKICVSEGKRGVKFDFFNDINDYSYDDWVVSPYYDSLIISGRFILGYTKGNSFVAIFDPLGKDIEGFQYVSLRGCYPYAWDYVIGILNNKIVMVNYKGKITNIYSGQGFPQVQVCGLSQYTNEEICLEKDKINYFYMYGYPGLKQDSIFISSLKKPPSISEIQFLNRSSHRFYIGGGRYGVLEKNYFLVKKGDKLGIANIQWSKSPKFNIELPINCEYIQETEYSNSIMFRQNGLYGFFPLHKTGKYIHVEKFGYNFARFELPNGVSGWTDIHGNEYPDIKQNE
jgi:hypothetical protein